MRLGGPVDGRELGAIFLGGAIGTLARAALWKGLAAGPASWPWATFAVNIAAALALGYLLARLHECPPPSPHRRAFLATGVCGALGTFSTMMLELERMIDGGHWGLALGYAGASLAVGFAAIELTSRLARRGRFPA